MIDFRPFYQQIATTNLSTWLETLPLQLKEWEKQIHGDYAKWSKIVDFLPDLQADTIDLKNAVKSDRTSPLSEGEKQRIIHHLKQLMPWRKGPYHLFDIHVDCEWRSDFKWDRVLPHLAPLKDRTILDVGCGSGYHMWRMVGEGAKMVVGIDPTELFLCQFEAVRKLLNNDRRANLIGKWLINGWCRETIFNLKLPMKKRYQEVMFCLENLAVMLAEKELEFDIQAKHLYHDREEITVHIALK